MYRSSIPYLVNITGILVAFIHLLLELVITRFVNSVKSGTPSEFHLYWIFFLFLLSIFIIPKSINLLKRILVMKPVILSNISRIQRARVRSNKPWNLLAALLDDGLNIKKRERISPRKTPRKINTEKPSMLIVVFICQIYKKSWLNLCRRTC